MAQTDTGKPATCIGCGQDDSKHAIEPDTQMHRNCRLTAKNLRITPAQLYGYLQRDARKRDAR